MNALNQDFEDYQNECLREMSSRQAEFMQFYDINSYEKWFYDHDIGAFHFKSDSGKNLYFKYVSVGSFSTKKDTWNWAWNNNSIPNHVKSRLEKVQAFGKANDFEQLTDGLFNGDEYTGWAVTSITAKWLNAMGMYRVPHDHLFIYFVFTNELTQEEYDALKDKFVECEKHNAGKVAFVCQHLSTDTHIGFNEAFETDALIDEEEDDCQAWCDECEKARLEEGEWNETSMAFADIKIVCDQCYFEIKRANQDNIL